MNRLRLAHERLLGWEHPPIVESYTERDCMLYALAVGVGRLDAVAADALAYAYEKELKVLPTMACVLAQARDWLREPWTGIDYARLLHAEEELIMHAPLPAGGSVTGRTRITRVEDKGEGKGALITMEKRVSDTATGLLLATTRTTIFARGNGGFGGERGASPPAPPPLAPTRQVEIATSPRMALLYRLTGDRNPLHADPEAAKLAGYDRPIGHGLSLLGAVAHALLAHGGAVTGVLRMLRTRFTSPFFPGETLCLLIEDASPRLRFELHSVERRVALLSRGEAHIE